MCHGRASAGWRWQHSSSLSPGVCRKNFLDSCRADVVPVWLVDSGASRPYLVQIKDLGHFGAPRWPPGSCRTLKKSPMLPLFEYNTQGQDRGPRQAARRFFLSGGYARCAIAGLQSCSHRAQWPKPRGQSDDTWELSDLRPKRTSWRARPAAILYVLCLLVPRVSGRTAPHHSNPGTAQGCA